MSAQAIMNSSTPALVIKTGAGTGKRVVLRCGSFSSPLKDDGTEYTQIVETDKDGTTTRNFKFGASELGELAFPQESSISITVVGTGSAYIVWAIE